MALDPDMRRRIRAHTAEGAEEQKARAAGGSKLDWSRVGFSSDTTKEGIKKKTLMAWPALAFFAYYGCISATSSNIERSVERSEERRAEAAERKRRVNNPWLLDEPVDKAAPSQTARNAR